MNTNRAAVSRGEIVGGHYRLERILAEGGMGIVWAARDLRLGRSVAIKFLGADAMANPVQRERFAREAQLASKIRSPHVVQIIGDGVTDSGVPFVVMELLDGESLASLLAREGPCSLATCGAIVEQVCRALSSAHTLGLVHRDIKPANIFLTPQPDGDVFVRLLDFGIAKELHFGPSGLTRAGELLGTTDYMSPEQFRKPEAVSAATDIWSLGVVVYEMLTGKLPFDESSFPSLVVRVAQGTFPPPSAVNPGLPPALDNTVLHALAIHPSQRYASVDEFGAAFLRVVRAHISKSVVRASDVVRVYEDDELTPFATPQPERFVEQPTVYVRRRPQFWGTLLVGVCALVLVGSWLVLDRAERGFASRESRIEYLPPLGAAEPVLEPPLSAAEEAVLHGAQPGASAEQLALAVPPPLDPLPAADSAVEPTLLAAQAHASAASAAAERAWPAESAASHTSAPISAAEAPVLARAPRAKDELIRPAKAPEARAQARATSDLNAADAPVQVRATREPNAAPNTADARAQGRATREPNAAEAPVQVRATREPNAAPNTAEARAQGRLMGELKAPARAADAPVAAPPAAGDLVVAPKVADAPSRRKRGELRPKDSSPVPPPPTAAPVSEIESKYGF